MTRFFIDHPRFAAIISLVITVAGLLAVVMLPVAQYPEIAPPEIYVEARFDGANAATVRDTVGAVLEQEVNGAEGMLYMKSTSAGDGSYTLIVTFEVGFDANLAQTLVQNRVNKASPLLPEEVRRSGIFVEKQASTMLMVVTLTSSDDRYNDLYLNNYATLNLRNALLRLPGVGKASVLNRQDYSARVWLDPSAMTARDITPQDVINAIREQNIVAAAGQVGASPTGAGQPFQFTLQAKGRMETAEEFENIILRAGEDGSLLYLKDVARLELGADLYLAKGKLGDRSTPVMAIYQQPGANALAVAESVKARLAELATAFPEGIAYQIPYDSTRFIEVSIAEVYETLALAVLLVSLVTFLFLQDWRATLIPVLTIPVSLIGTFLVMQGFGYSINTISLFALVLAIGIVVDAAIIVLENTERLMHEERLAVRDATLKAMAQVTGPLVASALVLLAIFLPVSALPGLTGGIFEQFGIVLSGSVLISTLVALTLAPPLCVLLLRESDGEKPWFFRQFNSLFDNLTRGYTAVAMFFSRHLLILLLGFVMLVGSVAWMFTVMPQSLAPREDAGSFFVEVELPPASSLPRTEALTDRMVADILATEGVRDVVAVSGYSLLNGATSSNAGLMIVTLDDWELRPGRELSQDAIFGRVAAKLDTYKEALVLLFAAPTIPGLGMTAGFEMMLEDTLARSPEELAAALDKLLVATGEAPEIGQAYSLFRADVPQLYLEVDRARIKRMGIPINDVFTALQTQLGGMYVNNITYLGRNTKVYVQAEARHRDEIEDINRIHVRGADGGMVPMKSLVEISNILGPQVLTRYNLYSAAAVNGEPAPGYSSGDAVRAMQRLADEDLPAGFTYEWTGSTYQELKAGNVAIFAFVLALLFAYMFLVAQYESWMIPVAILLVVPTALLGALAFTWAAGGDMNIFTQAGLVLMIGMASRNAILIVEFARSLVEEKGLPVLEAARIAAELRFRPLTMTAISFLLGVLPLVIATGAGDGSRQAIGQAAFGGMLGATVIGAVLTPGFYVLIQKLTDRVTGTRREAG